MEDGVRGTPTFRAIIIRERPVAIQRNADGTTLGSLKLLAVQLDRVRVREDHVVADAEWNDK